MWLLHGWAVDRSNPCAARATMEEVAGLHNELRSVVDLERAVFGAPRSGFLQQQLELAEALSM